MRQLLSLDPLRILLVFPGLELGGAERQGMHLARYLKERGCDVRIWGTSPGRGLVVEQCEAEDMPYAYHRFLWPCRKKSLIRDGWRLIGALRRIQPDVIAAYGSSASVGCGLAWRFSPVKVCIWGQRNTNDLYSHWLERFVYRRVSAIICNAEHQRDYLRETLGQTRVPVHVVHNGTSLAPHVKTRGAWRQDLDIPQDSAVVTMVANFRLQKDHPTLLHAWQKVLSFFAEDQPSPRLLLAGAPQHSYEDVRRLASDLDLGDTVTFLGQVKDVSGLLAASDIGVLASHHEGLPNVVVEYMAAGLPVVATDLPGCREALGDDLELPLCPIGDVGSLAARLHSLLGDPSLRRRLGTRNQQRAAEEFSLDKMCGTTAKLITELLNGAHVTKRGRQ